jgi:hypothetical protein
MLVFRVFDDGGQKKAHNLSDGKKKSQKSCCGGRDAAFFSLGFLAIRRKSQHMSMFSESREVL